MIDARSAPAHRLPLARLHRRWGGQLANLDGVEVVMDYGEPEREAAAVASGVALVDRSYQGRLEILGADRQRFLHGLVSCDVKGLAPGSGAYGFFPTGQGKIQADVVVLALEDRLWLELPPGLGAAISAHLAKFVIADRVEVLPLADMLPLTLVGPGAEALLADAVELPPGDELPTERFGHSRAMVRGIEVALVRHELAGRPAFTLWTSASVAPALLDELRASAGVVPAGYGAVERVRVLAGVPAFGRDFGPENFPQETGLEEQAVSYTKGCYLGQEIIARIHYRGKANHVARRLVFTGEPPARGAALLHEGQEVGKVGSVARGWDGEAVGIAVLHRRGAEPGTRLAIDGGGEAEVREL